jgi:hypothetical protein
MEPFIFVAKQKQYNNDKNRKISESISYRRN